MTTTLPRALLALLCLLALTCCAHSPPRPPAEEIGATIELVESAPVETTLDHPDVPNADQVWLEMIASATRSLDIAEFYASDHEKGLKTRLTPIIAAVRAAAERGVRVRFLLDEGFAKKYPETIRQLLGSKHLEVRKLDARRHMGGVQHAKYFVVDRREVYLGSQNFDWRSLEHIQEMGVRVRSKTVAGALLDVFNTDWELAAGAPGHFRMRRHPGVARVALESGEVVTFLASPKGWLPEEKAWDLPHLVKMIDGATSSVGVQLLTYKTKSYDGTPFKTLDEALRRAAARGVAVRLLVSDWSNKEGSSARESISGLARVPGIEVKVITIPRWSGGNIEFARVCHSKYLVVDGRRSWVGTSNWEGDYFHKSRNVGVTVEGEAFTRRLTEVLDRAWASAYAEPLVPMTPEEKAAEERRKNQPAIPEE